MRILFVGAELGRETADLGKSDPRELVMMVDVDRCISCGACELACRLEHAEESGQPAVFRPVTLGGERTLWLPLACRHCDDPCEYFNEYNFWITCPSTKVHGDAQVYCDGCAARIDEGLWPACASRCTMKTIYFGHAPDVAFALTEKRLREMGDVELTG